MLGAGKRLPRAVAARLRIALRLDDDRTLAAARVVAAGAQPVVAALLDQRRVAGLGNMWAQDLVVPGMSALTPGGIELGQGRGPAFAARVGILLPPRGAAFAQTVLAAPTRARAAASAGEP